MVITGGYFMIYCVEDDRAIRELMVYTLKASQFEAGFVWADILTALERVSDHCSNIAGCVIDMAEHNMNIHENIRQFRDSDEEFRQNYDEYDALYGKRLTSFQSS